MNLCNYNWNVMNLSLLSTFETIFREQSPENRKKYIVISPEKLKSVASFILDYVGWEAKFTNHWCIVPPIYFFFAAEETIMIEFAM